MSTMNDLPVAVIGGGPVGLAAAAQLVTRGVPVKLFESGDTIAAHVRTWGHVRLFSPWRFNTDKSARAILANHGWQEPDAEALPTGHELVDRYLQPLAETPAMQGVIETHARVHTISRLAADKVLSKGREAKPFALTIGNGSANRIELARAVIDATGTWSSPNPVGASGTVIPGETAHADRIAYGIPDILGRDAARYAGKRVLVIGGGHSAANALLDLAELAERDASLQLTWAVRGADLTRVFGGGADYQLSARGKLGTDLKRVVDTKRLELVMSFAAESVEGKGNSITLRGSTPSGARTLGPFDRIIVATGFRPDLSLTRELRLDLDPWLESARVLGPLIDPNLHSCGSVAPHGYAELSHPEPGYFAVGMKSYGRAPTFLMATGFEQVRSIAAHLAGDEKAALDVKLVLPETGVCSTNIVSGAAGECCGGSAPAKVDACCADDAKAKAAGASGCKPPEAAPKTSCCGPKP